MDLKQNSNYINISGIAGSTETAKSTVDLQLTARYPTSFRSNVTAIVMSKLTAFLPTKDFDKSMMQTNELEVLTLADPDFNKSARIDMILSADVYTELILEGMIKAHDNSYVAQETEIGWIVSGPIKKQRAKSAICMTASINEIDMNLQKFWELEEIDNENSMKPEEQECMDHFNETVSRERDGTYVVSLPFKQNAKPLGNSKRMAMAQFFQLEKKFKREPQLKIAYVKYIDELIEKGYMKLSFDSDNKQHCYLPHHPVQRE